MGKRSAVDWDSKRLMDYYQNNPIDLTWLDKPARHHYRWRQLNGRWFSVPRRISNPVSLLKQFEHKPPGDVYVGTASWLDPINLPKLRDKRRRPPILLDHLIVFDIDMRPFCRSKLEKARQATVNLLDWMAENCAAKFIHAVYSGGKGFHLIFQDKERTLFGIPEPREREQSIRKARSLLTKRVIDAGHPIDPVVTPDTRRIIRLPGTLHGKTGWQCTIIEERKLRTPFKHWINDIPRHEDSINIPRFSNPPNMWPTNLKKRLITILKENGKKKSIKKGRRRENKITKPTIPGLELQASSQVIGTKDRNALFWWLPMSWGGIDDTVQRFKQIATKLSISPVLFWQAGERVLALVPRAMPRKFLAVNLREFGLGRFGYHLDVQGHSWIPITPRLLITGEWSKDVIPIGQTGLSSLPPCRFPWSASHIHLAERMGQPLSETWLASQSEMSGRREARIRLAEMF